MACETLEPLIFQQPQCLVSTDKTGLKVEKSVLEQVRDLDSKLVVVAIAGLYRTGKSYLMNRLAGKNAGFALGSTIQSKTKGIWIWVRPHPTQEGTNLVLIDTEGLGDAEKGDVAHDNAITTLATLLSSTLVYNTLGVIPEDVVTKLNFVTLITQIIKKESSSGPESQPDVQLPHFIMTLRDFYLDLDVDGQTVTTDQYLEHILQSRPDRTKDINTLRENIRQYFPERRCFTFDRPTTKRAKLKQLESLEDGDLSEEFLKDSDIFTRYVHHSCPTLSLTNGTNITGSMYASLVESYVNALRLGGLPCVQNALQTMATQENRKAVERAAQTMREELSESARRLPLDEGDLDCVLASAMVSGWSVLDRYRYSDEAGKTSKMFDEKIATIGDEYTDLNRQISREECEKILKTLDYKIRRNMEQGVYHEIGGHEAYLRDVEGVRTAYDKMDKLGVMKEQTLGKYMEEADSTAIQIHKAQVKLMETQRRKENAAAERREAEWQAEEEERKKKRLKTEHEDKEKEEELLTKSLELQYELQLEELRLMYEQDTDAVLANQLNTLIGEHEGDMAGLEVQRILWEERLDAQRTGADQDIEFYQHDEL